MQMLVKIMILRQLPILLYIDHHVLNKFIYFVVILLTESSADDFLWILFDDVDFLSPTLKNFHHVLEFFELPLEYSSVIEA
jgi:hypothetical protein